MLLTPATYFAAISYYLVGAVQVGDEALPVLDDAEKGLSLLSGGEETLGWRDDSGDPNKHVLVDEHGTELMPKFWEKMKDKDSKKATIVFTDSGIGGLAVMSKFIERFQKEPIFSKARLIYYDMGGLEKSHFLKKVGIIWSMKPDILLVACNGMSAMYMDTQYSQKAQFPVISMLPFGRDLWAKGLEETADSILIMFVSPITDHQYVPLLKAKGVDSKRLQVQKCPRIIMAINAGYAPTSDPVNQEVGRCAKSAWDRMTPDQQKKPVLMGMGCTHFGWAENAWRSVMLQLKKAAGHSDTKDQVKILNPNHEMADYLFDQYPGEKPAEQTSEGIEVAVHLPHYERSKYSEVKKLLVGPLASAIDALGGKKSDKGKLSLEPLS